MQIINRLLLWQRFFLIGILANALGALPFYLYFTQSESLLEVARTELQGVEPLRLVMSLYKAVQDDRGLAVQLLSGVNSVVATYTAKQAEIDEHIAAIDTLAKHDRWDNVLYEHWQDIKADLAHITITIAQRSVTAQVTRQQHHDVIAKIHLLREHVAETYSLLSDQEKASFHIVKSLVYDITRLMDPIGLIRGSGADVLFRAAQSPAIKTKDQLTNDVELTHLIQRIALAREGLAILRQNIKGVVLDAPEKKEKLGIELQRLVDPTEMIINLTENEIIRAKTISYDFKEYRKIASQAIDAISIFNATLLKILDGTLQHRVANLEQQRITLLIIELTIAILGLFLSLVIVRSVSIPTKNLIDTMRRLARGDSGVRSSLNTADEIGELARQFNRMVDVQEAATNNIRNENEQLNNSVIMLLEVVAKLSQKDLTIHAPVAKDLTGPLGDALNMLTTEIARALQRISDISVDVTQASLSVREQADLVSSVADSEREQVEKTAVELDNAALTMLRIAKLAQTTNIAADKATLTTQNAIETVNATIASIEFIRETVRDAGGRIEQLGIHSQEISSVVDLIGGIARRTQILAVSASMHAASAGEAGQGFQVIANEVQRLAETAQQAAAKIGALLANIQGEIIDTVATMNSVTKQVMDGSKLAEQAGEQMRITQRTTSDLVTSVQIIAESSQEQAQSSADLLGRAHNIRKSTQLTSKQLKSQTAQTENLVQYARNLLDVIRVFKLPA